MPVLLGVLASLFIGISDTSGRASARRASALSHVSTQMLVGTVVSLPLVLVISSRWRWDDVLFGAISGALVALGLAVVYRAMADSSSAIVAPLAGVLSALIPLLWDILGGTNITRLALLGSAVAIASLVLVTFNPRIEGDAVRRGALLALLGGTFFGLSIAFAGGTSQESGVWPVIFNRAVGFVALVPLVRRCRVATLLPEPVRRLGVIGGIAGAIGMVALVLGSQRGNLGTVSVIAATYPVVVVVLSTAFDDDQLRWWQAIGIGGAVASSMTRRTRKA